MSEGTDKEFSGYRILLADDNEMELDVIAAGVESLGAECDRAGDGEELLGKLLGHDPDTYDLVLTDIYMPKKTGFEVCAAYREARRPDSRVLPFIGISADNNPELFEQAVNAGMNGMMNKPVTRRVLTSYMTLMLTEGRANAAFAARLQSRVSQLNRQNRDLSAMVEAQTGAVPKDTRRRVNWAWGVAWALTVVWGALLGLFWYGSHRIRTAREEGYWIREVQHTLEEAEHLLQEGSEVLTLTARRYAALGEEEDLWAYFREAEGEQRRERALEMVEETEGKGADSMWAAMAVSRELMRTEYHAMRLTAEASGLPEERMPAAVRNWKLEGAEAELGPPEKARLAQQLLFDAAYLKEKERIRAKAFEVIRSSWKEKEEEHRRLEQQVDRVQTVEDLYLALCALLLGAPLLGAWALGKYYATERARERLKWAIQERDAAVAAEESRSYFFASVSHDIRTPLNSIIGFSELLKLGNLTEEERGRYLDGILLSGRQLLDLINDVLDLAKLEAGKVVLSPEAVDVGKLAEEVALSFLPQAQQAGISIRAEVEEGVGWAELDRMHLKQVLVNLAGNAVKFTSRGGVTIRVKGDRGAGWLEVSVSDTGVGIAPQNLKRLMEPFVQLSVMDRTKGTGLGLAICKQLAEKMGGGLTVESQEGKGSTFTLRLEGVKYVDAPEDAEGDGVEERGGVEGVKGGVSPEELKVLLVDDIALNRLVLKQLLLKLGVKSKEASSGQEALEALSRERYDLVLTDMWMPGMGGEELVRIIRADEGLKGMPVYAVTADASIIKDYREMGFSGYFLKPMTLQTLRETLEKLGVSGGGAGAERH